MALFEKQIQQIIDGEHELLQQALDKEDQLLMKFMLGAQALVDYAREQLKGLDIRISFDTHEVQKAKPNE